MFLLICASQVQPASAQTESATAWSITVALAEIQYKNSAVAAIYVPTPPKPTPLPRVVPAPPPIINKTSATLVAPAGYNRWSCVSYIKYRRPDLNFIWGTPSKVAALDIPPEPGLAVITNEGNVGHVGLVTAVSSTSLTIIETNYIPGVTATRSLPLDDPVIRGYR